MPRMWVDKLFLFENFLLFLRCRGKLNVIDETRAMCLTAEVKIYCLLRLLAFVLFREISLRQFGINHWKHFAFGS